MKRHAKAASAGSIGATGNSRGRVRSAFVTRGARDGSKGSGAPSASRLRGIFAVLALAISALALTAASASADSAKMGAVSNVSYSSAHFTGSVDVTGSFGVYFFEYSTNPADPTAWKQSPGGFLGNGANQTVNKDVEGLLRGGTKYFARLTVSGVSSPQPYAEFTTLTVEQPTIVATDDATGVFSTSATVSGKVKRPSNPDPAFDISACRFEYVTDAQFTANGFAAATGVPCDQSVPITQPERTVNTKLTGLTASTTYHLRLAVENAAPGAATKEAAHTFTTLPPVAKPVVLAANDAFAVSKRTTKASGEIERPAGADPALDVSCRFEFVTDEQFTATGFAGAGRADCVENPVTSPAPGYPAVKAVVTGEPSGLVPNTKYHLRLAAENGGGTVTKEVVATFTTLQIVHPTISVDSVTEIGYTRAHVSATVDPGNQGFVWYNHFSPVGKEEWSVSADHFVQEGLGPQSVSFNSDEGFGAIQLKPGTLYQVKIDGYDAEEFCGNCYSAYGEFTTKGTSTPPSATLNSVTGVTETTAHFSGSVDVHAPAGPLPLEAQEAYKTDWHFECTPACPDNPGLSGTVSAEEGSQAISADAIRLNVNSYYEVKLVAENSLETVESSVQTFQTPLALPTVKYNPGGSDGEGGYYFQGVVTPNNAKVTDCHFAYGPTAAYIYVADCSPMPTGTDEVQQVNVDATEGQFKLTFHGQTTGDIAFNATPATVETELKALSTIGPSDIKVSGSAKAYVVTFNGGPLAGSSVGELKAKDGTTPLGGGGGVSVSTSVEGGNNQPVTVEAHATDLTPNATYHVQLFVTTVAGTKGSGDNEFIPTLAPGKGGCANETLREENNSTALPECRAYEQVSPPAKEGYGADVFDYTDDGSVLYKSEARNLANSGPGFPFNFYTSIRTSAGWETIPNLNGLDGSHSNGNDNNLYLPETWGYSADLRSILLRTFDYKDRIPNIFLRRPDGTYAVSAANLSAANSFAGVSADLSHLLIANEASWQPSGLYEYIGTVDAGQEPRRVDVDNSGNQISNCLVDGKYPAVSALGNSADPFGQLNPVSEDGSVIYFKTCSAGPHPPIEGLWARVDGTTSYNVSASHCTRTAADPGGACNAPTDAFFQAASDDGSRVFFTTTQQLVNGDTDETSDLYAYDLPTAANPSSSLTQVSGASSKADVESVIKVADDGSAAYFTARGILVGNEDALGNTAVAGDKNLYVWRKDAANPAGETTFVARLTDPSLSFLSPQTTSDGRYLVLGTATSLVENDADTSRDIYRYDAETGEMLRVSANIFGLGGNANFDASLSAVLAPGSVAGRRFALKSHHSVSSDGEAIVFVTAEGLSPLDGNGTHDVYLWKAGHVSLISSGSAGGAAIAAAISASGQDIYFDTSQPLSPKDGDRAFDVYDARAGGGFRVTDPPPCSGEACQGPAAAPPAAAPPPTSGPAGPEGPPASSKCPKGKVKKHGKCVKKPAKKHHSQRASHKKRGGGK